MLKGSVQEARMIRKGSLGYRFAPVSYEAEAVMRSCDVGIEFPSNLDK